MKFSLAKPSIGDEEWSNVQRAVFANQVDVYGDYISKFEDKLAGILDVDPLQVVAIASGTAGLQTALLAVGVVSGDMVVVPSLTFVATANAVTYCSAYPWFFDVYDKDWCIDCGLLESQFEKHVEKTGKGPVYKTTGARIGAILAVHLLGNSCNVVRLKELSIEYKVPLIYDACQALVGGVVNSRSIVGFADCMSVFSFNLNKIVTCGMGGAIVGPEDMILKVRKMINPRSASLDDSNDGVGFNYRMTNLHAAVGCAQLDKLNDFVDRKKKIRGIYDFSFGRLIFMTPKSSGSNCWMFGVVLDDSVSPDDLIEYLDKQEIESTRFSMPIHDLPAYKDCFCCLNGMASRIYNQTVLLPSSVSLSDNDVDFVASKVKEFLIKDA